MRQASISGAATYGEQGLLLLSSKGQNAHGSSTSIISQTSVSSKVCNSTPFKWGHRSKPWGIISYCDTLARRRTISHWTKLYICQQPKLLQLNLHYAFHLLWSRSTVVKQKLTYSLLYVPPTAFDLRTEEPWSRKALNRNSRHHTLCELALNVNKYKLFVSLHLTLRFPSDDVHPLGSRMCCRCARAWV